ncbi:MAG: 4-(cytidine 5'-diphospho)-2-C-methyl-D-erythritol kinase [Actinomycetota bacterium]
MTRRGLREVIVEGAAKVNLGWRVGAKRDDGFHEVDGRIQTISLTDRLVLRSGEVGWSFEVPGHPELEGDDNLVRKAAVALSERLSDVPPTHVVLEKRIPIAAGLGGGSADAAAALVGLNTLWGLGLSAKELLAIGADIGSDVPAILVGGLVHATGRGADVRSVGCFDGGWFVIGAGAEHVSAGDAYAAFARVGGSDRTDDYANDLEPAACELLPGLGERLAAMREAAGAAFVSGSGPTVVGLVADEAAARSVVATVASHFSEVHVAGPSEWGVRLTLGS